jgi:hypothetical protein
MTCGRELDVELVEHRVVPAGAEVEDAELLAPHAERNRERGGGLHVVPLLPAIPARVSAKSGSGGERVAQHHIGGVEGALDLGDSAAGPTRRLPEHRVLERGDHGRRVGVGTSKEDRAARDAESLRHPTHQDLVDLVRRERARDLAQDLDHFGARPCLRPRAIELAAGAEVRLHPGQDLADPERLRHEVGRAESEGLHRAFLRGEAS